MISFDNADVQDMIQQFGETGKVDTIKHLDSVIPIIRDWQAKEILEFTRDKLSALSDGECADLIAFIKKYKDIEHGHSLKVRPEKAKAAVKVRDAERQHRAQDRQRQ